MANNPKFSIDPSVIYQLGESLISDPVQALLELVKNSYDADASYSKVTIDTTGKTEIEGLKYATDKGIIIIEDDGFGMDDNDIQNGWLRISNRHKKIFKNDKKITEKGRTPLGDKGLGRLGTQRLGHNLEIFTKKEDSNFEYQYSFSWDDFSKENKIEDVEVNTKHRKSDKKKGTTIVISNLNEKNIWENEGIKILENEFSKLISPYEEIREFNIIAKVNGIKLDLMEISPKIRDIAQLHYDISFNSNLFFIKGKVRLDFLRTDQKQNEYTLFIEPDNGEDFYKYLSGIKKTKVYNIKKIRKKKWFIEYSKKIELEDIDKLEKYEDNKQTQIYNPGKFYGVIDYYDLSQAAFQEQNIYNRISEFRNMIKSLCGIKIYRNGFGIRVDEDWLQLGTQWTSASSYYGLKPGNTLGYIAITAKENIDLEEMTDREGFKKTPYYNNFFLLMQIFVKFACEVQEYLRRSWNDFCREKNENKIDINLYKDVKEISNEIKKRIKQSKTHRKSLDNIKSRLVEGKNEVQKIHEKIIQTEVISKKLKNEIEITLNIIYPLMKEATKAINKNEEYLAQLEPIENMEQVVSDRVESLKEQLNDFLETVALGLTAEALSHEIFNITDTLSQKTDYIRNYLHKQKDYDINISAYIEFIKSTALALRKQISYLSPALRYVRDKKQHINFKDFFIEFKEHYQPRLEKSGIIMNIATDQLDLFEIKINKGKLLQIFDNFILNSEYWLREDIRMNRLKKGTAEIIIELDNPFVRISDNGHGVDPTIESIVFEPFISAKGKGKGRGLGLFIIKQFLDSEGCSAGLLPQRNSYKRLKNITIQDFDYIVCKAANDEGTWEPDMLFRIYNTYHRKEAEQIALKDEELHNISTEIRKASQLQPCLEPESRNVIKYENEERYLTGEYLNSNHLPIELGDIFYNGNSKYFILLSQPCDLMMRIENGKIGRSYNLNDALLFEIVNKPNNIDPFCTPELKYWKYKTNKNYFLNFRKKHIIKLCILDLCVFNRDGKSVFDSELNCPERVIPLWQLYYSKHIKKNLKKIASFYKKIGKKTFKLSDTEKSLIRTYTIYPFQINYQNKKGENFIIKFNCQRVGRLQRNRAEAILSQYSFHMSRAAFERDLGKKMS